MRNWIHSAQGTDYWRALVNAAYNFGFINHGVNYYIVLFICSIQKFLSIFTIIKYLSNFILFAALFFILFSSSLTPSFGHYFSFRLHRFPQGPLGLPISLFPSPQLKVPPGGLVLRIFTSWKNPSISAGFEPANLGSRGELVTTRPPRPNN